MEERTINESENPLYSQLTINFIKAGAVFCKHIDDLSNQEMRETAKILSEDLSSLYLAALCLPQFDEDSVDPEMEDYVSEMTYNRVSNLVSTQMGAYDDYLTANNPDMQFCDTAILARISEDVADIYQDIANMTGRIMSEQEEIMTSAVAMCQYNFKDYWGMRCLNAMSALHALLHSGRLDEEQ